MQKIITTFSNALHKQSILFMSVFGGLLFFTSLPMSAVSSKITQEDTNALSKSISHSVIDAQGTVLVAQGEATAGIKNETQIARLAFKRAGGNTAAEFVGIADATNLQNKKISALALAPNGLPVAAQVKKAFSTVRDENVYILAMRGINDNVLSSLISTNYLTTAASSLNIAAKKPSSALASTGDYILAAINASNDDKFGDAGSGVALVALNAAGNNLVQRNHDGKYDETTPANNKSFGISGSTSTTNNFSLAKNNNANAQAGSKACMCYDEHLDLVYLGVGKLQAGSAVNNAALALVLLELQDADNATAPGYKKIVAYPALGVAKNSDSANNKWNDLVETTNTIGACVTNLTTGITHVATMHTSTGKDYLVVVNREAGDKFGVFSVPVMPKGNDGKGMMGVVDADGNVKLPTTADADKNQLKKTARQNIVGNAITFLKAIESPVITALRVVGDTVYVCVQGDRGGAGNNNEAGIFASRAIFNKSGNIIAWTPWERVYGFEGNGKINTFEVDRRTGQITAVTSTTAAKTSTERWAGNADNRLPKILSGQFNDGIGVLGMFNFDADTPAFKRRFYGMTDLEKKKANVQEYSLMVATGFGKVALIETGKRTGTSAIAPTEKYELTGTGAVDNSVHMFNADGSDAALTNLGPIITADLARVGESDSGYLFVGGKGGVAVLRKDADGKGWDAAANGDANKMSTFLGAAPNALTFAQMKDTTGKVFFTNTRKIIATQKYVFIMTDKEIYRVEIKAATFANTKIGLLADGTDYKTLITDLHKVTVDVGGTTVKPFNSSDELYDMMVMSNEGDKGKLLVATSQGVFVVGPSVADNDGVNAGVPNPTWAYVKDSAAPAQEFICGPAFKFESVSAATGGLFTAIGEDFVMDTTWLGNVYVTALDKDCKKLNVYRLAVDKDGATLIKEPYTTEHFYTIGSYDHFARPAYFASEYDFQPQAVDFANHGQVGDFTVSELIPNPALFVQKQPINLNLDISSGLQLAQTVHDATGGITYAYGQFGVRALE